MLYVLKGLVEQFSPDDILEADISIKLRLDNLLSKYAEINVHRNWKYILRQLDGPDASGRTQNSTVFYAIDSLDNIHHRGDPPRLKALYERVLKLIMVNGYYLPSEALKYYCEAFSLNISLWYPDIERPGTYLKQEEYGVGHSAVFMLRQIEHGLECRRNRENKQWEWNHEKE